MDLIIRNGRLLDRTGSWDIGVQEGRISVVADHIGESGTREIDAGAMLVTPTYVNGHVHLDKCNVGELMRADRTYSFQECLELTWAQKRTHTVEQIVERASRAVREGILNGTTVFRVFADVDTIGGLTPIRGVIALREKWRGVADIEAVAFPQEGLGRDLGSAELMDEAMRLGADVVGGLPWHELNDEEMRAHVDFCFDLAKRYEEDIHVLADDTLDPASRSLEYLAAKTIEEGFEGRVSASHCEALAAYDDAHAEAVMGLVREAGVSISTNPHISLALQGRISPEPIPRGTTRIKPMWEMGVNLFASQDDVDDPFYPFGRNDQQEVASYVCHAAHMLAPPEVRAAFDFVTTNAAKAMRLADYGMAPGCWASVNVLAASTVQHVLRLQQPPAWVIRRGEVLAQNRLVRELVGSDL